MNYNSCVSCCHCSMLQMWLHWWLMECKCEIWMEGWLCDGMQVHAACCCDCRQHRSTATDDWDIWLVSDSYWRNLSRAVWGSEWFLSYPWPCWIFGCLFQMWHFAQRSFQYLSAEHNYSDSSDVLTSCMLIHICSSSPLEINLVHSPVFDNYHLSLKPLCCYMSTFGSVSRQHVATDFYIKVMTLY